MKSMYRQKNWQDENDIIEYQEGENFIKIIHDSNTTGNQDTIKKFMTEKKMNIGKDCSIV